MAILSLDTPVFVDMSQRSSMSDRYIIRHDSCYHLYRDCRCLDNVDKVLAMRRSAALLDNRLVCGLCQSQYASEVLASDWHDVSDLCDISGKELCFDLNGSYNQTLLISAVRWCLGLGQELEAVCRDVVFRSVGFMAPNTAALIAREIREWWCDFVWDEGVMAHISGIPHSDVCDWAGLLPVLDERSAHSRYATSYDLRPPFVSGKNSWNDFPEIMRPTVVGILEPFDDDKCCVQLQGVKDQLVLVAAVLYCFGRSSYMPGLTVGVLSKSLNSVEPVVAQRIAKLIREWWCSRYDFDWPHITHDIGSDTVLCWFDILSKFDDCAGVVDIPEVRGVDSWDDVADVVRPRNVEG